MKVLETHRRQSHCNPFFLSNKKWFMTLSVNSPCNIIFVIYLFIYIKVKDNISATKKKRKNNKVKDNNISFHGRVKS